MGLKALKSRMSRKRLPHDRFRKKNGGSKTTQRLRHFGFRLGSDIVIKCINKVEAFGEKRQMRPWRRRQPNFCCTHIRIRVEKKTREMLATFARTQRYRNGVCVCLWMLCNKSSFLSRNCFTTGSNVSWMRNRITLKGRRKQKWNIESMHSSGVKSGLAYLVALVAFHFSMYAATTPNKAASGPMEYNGRYHCHRGTCLHRTGCLQSENYIWHIVAATHVGKNQIGRCLFI